MKPLSQNKQAGFTLVELSIVLVIIGLIIGGVLVGQDLIKAAEIRSTVGGFEKYNAAAITFRNKYNGLPGDLLASRANQFGMTWRDATLAAGRTGGAGRGDGNGSIEGCAASATALGCETAGFWMDLTDAQLIADAFVTGTATTGALAPTGSFPGEDLNTVVKQARYLPNAPLRDNALVHIYPEGGRNYWGIHSYSTITSAAGLQTLAAAGVRALTPLEASQIDEKMDDGIPTSGIVKAISALTVALGATTDPGATPAAAVCVNFGAAAPIIFDETYNVANTTWANALNCLLGIRASF